MTVCRQSVLNMDKLRLPAVVDRVVAWHNRHPLARRIAAGQVHAIGYVALPFTAEAPPPAALKRDFSARFIDTLSHRQVARFALKQGQVLAQAPLDGSVREVPADGHPLDDGAPEPHRGVPATVYLLTAVIETDTRKSRVLLGSSALVLGRRIHSTPRIAALLAVLAAAAVVALVVGMPRWGLQLTVRAPQPPGLPQARAEVPVPVRVEVPVPVQATAPVEIQPPATEDAPPSLQPQAPMPTPAPTPAPTIVPAVVAAPARAEIAPLRRALVIVPVLSDAEKAQAREQRRALMAAAAAAPARVAEPPTSPSLAPAPASGPVFAISTRSLRTRAEAEQLREAMQALLHVSGQPQVHVDVLPQGDDWRVVALPFAQRADAEKGRALLVSRGMRVAVVDF